MPRRKSMDPSIICNPEEPSPRPTIMRVRSTGSIQLCQNTPLVKHPIKAPMQGNTKGINAKSYLLTEIDNVTKI